MKREAPGQCSAVVIFQLCIFAADGKNCTSALLEPHGHSERQLVWVDSGWNESTQNDNPMLGLFFCMQHSGRCRMLMDKCNSFMKGLLSISMLNVESSAPYLATDLLHASVLAVIFMLYVYMWFQSCSALPMSQSLLFCSAPQPVGRASSHVLCSACTKSPGAMAVSVLSCPSQRPTGSATKRSAMRRLMSTQLPRPDLVSEGCWGEGVTCEGRDEAQHLSIFKNIYI